MMANRSHTGWALALAIGASGLCGGAAPAQTIALTHAIVIDGTGAPAQRDMTLLIDGGVIRAMGANLAVPAGATAIDLSGKFIVPGIINAHGHVGPAPRDPQLRQFALFGVTTTTSMSFDPDDIQDFKSRQAAGELRGARILTVMYRFMSEPQHPGSEYKTPAQARAKVDEIVSKDADFVKVWIDDQGGRFPKLAADYTEAVMDQARKHRKIRMAHIVTLEDARRIVHQGVNILVHNVRDQEIPDDFLSLLKEKNVSVISTLAREEALFVYGSDGAPTDNPFFQKSVSAERLTLLRTQVRERQANDPNLRLWHLQFENDKKNLKKLADAGVRFGFGTDSGGAPDRYFIQGWFEHRQMELMRDAGLTPMQIIQSFSRNNAEMLGIDRHFGTLAEGKAADLLVLARNPLDDITNMRTIEVVYLGGRKFE